MNVVFVWIMGKTMVAFLRCKWIYVCFHFTTHENIDHELRKSRGTSINTLAHVPVRNAHRVYSLT